MKSELLDINDLADEVAIELLHPSIERLRALLPDASEDTLKQVRASLEDWAFTIATAKMDAEPPKRSTAPEDDLNKLDALFGFKRKPDTYDQLSGERVVSEFDGALGVVTYSDTDRGCHRIQWDDGDESFAADFPDDFRLARKEEC